MLPRRDSVGLFVFIWFYFILFCFLDELLMSWEIFVSKMLLSVYLTYSLGLIHRSSKPVIVQPTKAGSLFQTAEFCWKCTPLNLCRKKVCGQEGLQDNYLNLCHSGLKTWDSKEVPLITHSARVTFCTWGSWEAVTTTPKWHWDGLLRESWKGNGASVGINMH